MADMSHVGSIDGVTMQKIKDLKDIAERALEEGANIKNVMGTANDENSLSWLREMQETFNQTGVAHFDNSAEALRQLIATLDMIIEKSENIDKG